MIKKSILIFTFFLYTTHALSLEVIKVALKCEGTHKCNRIEKGFKSLVRSYDDLEHVQETIKIYVANEGIKRLQFKLIKEGEDYAIEFIAEQKPRINELNDIEFVGGISIELPTVIPLREDDYFDKRKLDQTVNLYLDVAREKGYPESSVKPVILTKPNGVDIGFKIDLKSPVVLTKINISSKSSFLNHKLSTMLGEYEKKPLDLQQVKAALETARKLFIQQGFYLIDLEFKSKFITPQKAVIFINMKNTRAYSFYLKGMGQANTKVMKKYLSSSLIAFKREMSVENVTQSISEWFEVEGMYESVIEVNKIKLKSFYGEPIIQYMVNIVSGHKVKISNLEFKGSSFYSANELSDMFFESGSSLIKANLHDANYYNQFSRILRENYIAKGFTSVYIDKPFVKYIKQSKDVSVTYRVREGVRTQIKKINISGVEEKLKNKISSILKNVEGQFFNPIALESDLSLVVDFLKNNGFYYARISNLNANNLVVYKQDNSVVDINIDIDSGLKLFVGKVIIIGNNKTRKLLVKRELQIAEDDLLTIEKIERSQVALLSLGIFNSVQIQPVSSNKSKTDILVFVREKDFGTIEVAPGIRTDIGLKVSTIINYNNLEGMNKKITFKGSVNQRLNLNSLDEERRKRSNSLIEYDSSVNYSENHLFHSEFDFDSQISKSRKRFYSFDADIQRFTVRFSRDFTRWFNSSIKYQIETISQFDATVETEHGHFQIGSITPAMTFDFRDRTINPTKGASFAFSCEFANPALLSQQNDELTINYYKLINRNRFYHSMSRDVVLAISTSFGIQENFATNIGDDGDTEGYIPNIKVFRLTGADNVRGYEDNEINRLISKQDISKVVVNSRAYMANLKFEPRLMLSDSTVLGVFYDAGRIFVDEFKPDHLRSSVGISFKYLTPVGSLDFDYGIKLLRKRDEDGTLDSPGRLHVSIGFF